MDIGRDEALRYYRGQAVTVVVRAENGQTLSFPAHHIRPFVEVDGVHGLFSIRFDASHKLVGIRRLRP